MSFSLGHTLVTPLPDGRVSYTPCRHCGEECRGHVVSTSPDARITAYVAELPAGRTPAEYADSLTRPPTHCRTCGAECALAQCDTCREDGEMNEMQASRVTIDRRTAEILSDAAHAQACELRRLAEDCTPGDRAAILAEAAEIDEARTAIDAALGRSVLTSASRE